MKKWIVIKQKQNSFDIVGLFDTKQKAYDHIKKHCVCATYHVKSLDIDGVIDSNVLREYVCKYFEYHSDGSKNLDYDATYSAQDFVDDVSAELDWW